MHVTIVQHVFQTNLTQSQGGDCEHGMNPEGLRKRDGDSARVT